MPITSDPTHIPSTSIPTGIPTTSIPTDIPTKPTVVTTLTLDMKCPDDLKSFQAELASEIAKINDKVVIQGVACGSVIITLQGDSEEVQTVSTYIVDTGLNLPSYGKVGGKPETTR
eukprot:UN00433